MTKVSALPCTMVAAVVALAGCGGGVKTRAGSSTASASGAGGASTASSSTSSGSGAGAGGAGGTAVGASVLQRNNHATRDGLYVQPQLTKANAAKMHRDTSFNAGVVGNVYAQPLYVEKGPGGVGTFLVVTENNNVHAIAEAGGGSLWTRSLGTPAGNTGAGCGNIAPIGITGTPYIDLPSRTMYLSAAIGTPTTILRHEIHALSIDDGTERPGFPVDTSTVNFNGVTFSPTAQGERGALLAVSGTLYVPYGGHYGDCGDYRGWVIGVPLTNPSGAKGWATGALAGGIWAPGGLASDGQSIFAATGNTIGTSTWAQGNAIVRFSAGPVFSAQSADYFTPSDWKTLDDGDVDLGGSGPIIVDVPGATPSALVLALGKNGVAYLLDRSNLGGLGKGDGTTGEGISSARVANGEIINAAATYTTASGVHVVLHVYMGGGGYNCPNGTGGNLVGLTIGAASPPTIKVAWCADSQGEGSPIVTTTDGKSEAIVWIVAAEQNPQRLRGFDGETGAVIFDGGTAGDSLPNKVRRFSSPIAVKGRIITAADGALYAFKAP